MAYKDPVTPRHSHLPPLSIREPPLPRIATYSQGMHGFGHIRRNATIAHALRGAGTQAVILMIAEAWQAGAIPMPHGVDCVTLPGLREVLQDPETVRRTWSADGTVDAMRDYYDAIWIYGDPAVFDPVREYGVFDGVASKVRYTGYLDQRPRLEFAGSHAAQVSANLPPGRLALCVVGGGVDGHPLAEAFVEAELPADTTGIVVTGPYMPPEMRHRLLERAQRHPRCYVLEFVPDPAPLIDRADRIIAMGGYNTICEVLSFEKHALIVPRVHPEPEQWLRAQRLRDLGLIEVLHPDDLGADALTAWLARDLGPPPASRSRVDVSGLTRIPGFLAELLGVSFDAAAPVAREA